MKAIRKPAVAGTFYPADEKTLVQMINGFINDSVSVKPEGQLKAIVVPHAGYVYSGIVAAAGFKLLKQLDPKKKWKVLLLGPSHFVILKGAAAPEVEGWETPLGTVLVKNILDEMKKSDVINQDEEAFRQEHSLEVEVPFLQMVMKKWMLYPLCLGELNPKILAVELKDFVSRDDVITVVSSDLSHYFPYEDAVAIDENANEFIPKIAINEVRSKVEACGIMGIMTLLHLADVLGWKGHFIDYKNSGDTAGDKNQVVGYGCYAFTK
ncbi:AmmeMemoRadiSam system protein B [Candidatus Peregrinibacteria bacterium]|nr:AmmeMemoRadiSam system protein B [Candidatus Peregrinibacteria bacterium]